MPDSFRVVALLSAYNEGDIISAVIGHLVEEGIEAYLLDNHSTDDTAEQARQWLGRGLLAIEPFPHDNVSRAEATGFYDWTAILGRKEQLASELGADWYLHHDADEFRESPWPGMNLKEAIRWVDRQGYNCIDYRVYNFPPIDDGFRQGDDPRSYFTFYEEAAEFDRLQLKTWKATDAPVSLLPSGGHQATFEGRRVFPIPFLLRHYPVRGQSHGLRKVFAERKGRFLERERVRGWHVQYDRIGDETHVFLRDPAELRPFDLETLRLQCMLPEDSLLNLAERLVRTDTELESLRASVERDLAGYRAHAATLEADRDGLRAHAANLERERRELRQRAAELEQELEHSRQHRTLLDRRLETLERELALVHDSRSRRWTILLRRFRAWMRC